MDTPRFGTVDIIDGLIAVISERMRERKEREIGVTHRELARGLQHLQNEKGYELYLDFDNVGSAIYSKRLDDYLFFSGVFECEIKRASNIRYYTLSKRKVTELGDSFRKYIEKMADEFERYSKEVTSASK